MEEVYEQGEAPSAARIAAESGLSSLLVLFSSQTGNAAAAACDVWREVQRQLPLKEQPILLPFGAVWRRLLGFAQKQKATKDRPARVVVVLVVATAGYGEVPDDLKDAWAELLRTDFDADLFQCLDFSAFGLGDSRYEQFNFACRKLRARLLQLGAREFCPLGLGDEQHDFGYEGELDPWLGLLIQRLRKEASHLFRCDSEEKELAPTHDGFWLPPPLYAAKLLGTSARKPLVSVQRSEEALVDQSVLPLIHRILLLRSPPERQNGHSVVFAQVVKSRRISASGHFQRIYFLQLKLPQSVSEELLLPGASVAVFPHAPFLSVWRMLEALRISPQAQIRLSPAQPSSAWRRPGVSSEEEGEANDVPVVEVPAWKLFGCLVDVCARPSRFLLRLLAHFLSNGEVKEKLLHMSSRSLRRLCGERLLQEGKDEFCEYCRDQRRGVSDAFWDFCIHEKKDAAHSHGELGGPVPLPHLLSSMLLLQPRKYSLANFPIDLRAAPSPSLNKKTPSLRECSHADVKAAMLTFASQFVLWKRSPVLSLLPVDWANALLSVASSAMSDGTARSGRAEKCEECQTGGGAVVDLCLSLVEHETSSLRKCFGVCSFHLTHALVGTLLPVYIQPSVLPLPFAGLAAPLLIVATGTGVAPVRSLLQRRRQLLQQLQGESLRRFVEKRGPDLLFLGFRHPDSDFLFADEWASYSPWLHTHVAFSRSCSSWCSDGESVERGAPNLHGGVLRSHDDVGKVYVQTLLRLHAKKVCSLLVKEQSAVLICGKSHPMPSQIKAILELVLEQELKFLNEDARELIQRKRASGRYFCETWG